MCCHKQYETVPPVCIPIQCGSDLNAPVKGAVRDDAGENISAKNREYCELTAHYYAWKNVSAEHYGFCHYRRFFCADNSIKKPYLALKAPREKLFPNEEQWRELTAGYDVIVPRSEDMGISAKEHYCTARYHYPEDMELFFGILKEKAPIFIEAAENYLSQERQYFCNMFVMSKEYFFEYCENLFAILEEFDKCKTLHGDFRSDRTDGYLGEIFTGIYITYLKDKGVKILELPRADVDCTLKKRILYALLPPESKRRFCAKKIIKAIGKRK